MDNRNNRFVEPICYYASLKNDETIKHCASGGVAYALSEQWLSWKENVAVYGVAYAEDFKTANFIRVSDKKDLIKLCGSKYIYPSELLTENRTVYESVYEDIRSGTKVLFLGLPCHISKLQIFLEKHEAENVDGLFTVDLICHGPMEATIQAEYIEFLEKKYKSKVIDFSVRYKNPDWEHISVKADFANGKKHVRKLYDTDIGRAFFTCARKCAYQCRYKNENRKSDITIGDYWGVSSENPAYNAKGTSIVACHTVKGMEVMQSLHTIYCGEVPLSDGLKENPSYYFCRSKNNRMAKFEKLFHSRGLHCAVLGTRSLLGKCKYFIQLVMRQHPY